MLENYVIKNTEEMFLKQENIRNFSIIAHIDHGKSTLADRLLEKTGSVEQRLMEEQLLERINALGIGPQGLGGKTTALAVNIETFPTHIAGLPVAVNINCHVTRHQTEVL